MNRFVIPLGLAAALLLALLFSARVRALAARWLELPVAAGGRLALSTGAVCVLGFEREVRVLWRWNET
jgi:probable phosphoglycerate mutase